MSGLMKIAFWAVIAGQIILLVAFIAVKENTLRTGTSVLLQTVPIDPRSLLQGDFAILNYEISELPDYIREERQGDRIYVELIKQEDGVWRANRYSSVKPDSDRTFIKGTVTRPGRLEFGIDTYFIPERTGDIIARAGDVKVRVAVSSGGTAVIEELLLDGEPFDPSRPPDLPRKEPPRPPEPAQEPERKP